MKIKLSLLLVLFVLSCSNAINKDSQDKNPNSENIFSLNKNNGTKIKYRKVTTFFYEKGEKKSNGEFESFTEYNRSGKPIKIFTNKSKETLDYENDTLLIHSLKYSYGIKDTIVIIENIEYNNGNKTIFSWYESNSHNKKPEFMGEILSKYDNEGKIIEKIVIGWLDINENKLGMIIPDINEDGIINSADVVAREKHAKSKVKKYKISYNSFGKRKQIELNELDKIIYEYDLSNNCIAIYSSKLDLAKGELENKKIHELIYDDNRKLIKKINYFESNWLDKYNKEVITLINSKYNSERKFYFTENDTDKMIMRYKYTYDKNYNCQEIIEYNEMGEAVNVQKYEYEFYE
jgi:hypothetical protein